MDRRAFLSALPKLAVGLHLLRTALTWDRESTLESVDDVQGAFAIGDVFTLNADPLRTFIVTDVVGSLVTYSPLVAGWSAVRYSAWNAGSVIVRGLGRGCF